MSGFTKQAIQASFLKLLDTYPLRDITVRMLTEDCGINRKSFYYHDQDIPALLEQILADRPLCWSLRTSRCARWRNA